MKDLKGKTAIVTGGGGGIGGATSRRFAEEGAQGAVFDMNLEAAQKVADGITASGGKAEAFQCDITDRGQVDAAVAAAESQLGPIDVLVNNAGWDIFKPFTKTVPAEWDKLIEIYLTGSLNMHLAVLHGMVGGGGGRIVNIASSAVKAPIDILGLSNGARSGLTGFVAGVARTQKLAGNNVTINNLLPGKFDTDRLAATHKVAAEKTGKSLADIRAVQEAQIPAGRFGNAQEFGDICAFLCSLQAGYITGQNILPDGGLYPGTY